MLKIGTTVKNTEKLRHFTLAGITMILSFIASGGEIFSFPSPVNVIIASLSGGYGIYALAASALSYIISGGIFSGIVNLCSIATVIAIRLVLNRTGPEPNIVSALMTSSVFLLYSAIISLVTQSDINSILFYVLSSFICFAVIYSVKVCWGKYSNDGILDMSGGTGIMIAVIFIFAIATLTGVSILGINLGRALGIAVMLFAANKYKHIGGAVYGALAAVGVIICSTDMAKNTLLLAVAGLICGAFANLGIIAVIISLGATVLGGIFLMGTNADSFKLLADVIVGTVAYLCIPDNKVLSAFKMIGGSKKSPEISCKTASAKLNFASKSVFAVREQILQITEALEKKLEPTDLSQKVKMCVCRDCSKFSQCWSVERSETASIFSQLSMRANANGAITAEDIKLKHPSCCKKEVLCNSYNMLFLGLQYEQGRKQRMKELRELLCSQLEVMSQMFDDLSANTRRLDKIDVLLSDAVADIVYKHGVKNAKICAYIDPSNQPTIEIYIPKNAKPDMVKLTVEISEAACTDLEMPVISMVDDMKKLEFAPRPYFDVEWDVLSSSAVFGDYSGDYYEFLKSSPSRQYIILSDGMGTGKRARLDSMFTVNLVTRLLTSGASPTTAAALINSILRVKSWEESFATLDIADINLSTGEMSILKCGANSSFLIRKGALTTLDSKTFPLGILSDTAPETVSARLERDDILLICSDGIDRQMIEKALSETKSPNKRSAQEIIQLITREISLKKTKARPDDITVIAAKITI